MKITFVIPKSSTAGGIRVVSIYAEKLANLGHDITVLSIIKRGSLRQEVRALLKELKFYKRGGDTTFFDNLTKVNFEEKLVDSRGLLNKHVPDADAVIATWWETAKWVDTLAVSKGKKLYLVQGHEIFSNLPIEQVKLTYRSPIKKIVVSSWLKNIMEEQYKDLNTVLLGNGVDTEHFHNTNKKEDNSFYVGILYSAAPCKNSKRAVDAFKVAKQKVPSLKLIGFGSVEPLEREVKEQFDEFYISPEQKKIPEIYSLADTWLFSSDEEGFGLPILESMACGTPVIATPAGAATELLSSGHGILLEDFCVKSMANAIFEMSLLDANQKKFLSKQCREVAIQYSWDKLTLKLESILYEECIDRITQNYSSKQC